MRTTDIEKRISEYKKTIYRALRDRFLRISLTRTVDNYRKNWAKIIANFPDLPKKAERLRKIKLETIKDLWYYVDKAQERLRQRGINIYSARNAEEARTIIGDLCEGKLVVKSKSLTTEEIKLNEYLEKLGAEVWETDLGELIIQLAKSKPMHLVTPSIHIPKEKVAEIFSRIAGEDLPPDPKVLVGFARRLLREKYFKADVGITGANVVAADTGSIFLVENEGNIRFVSNTPPIHIVVVGIEKIVPTFIDAALYVDVLAKYAGFLAPSYISIISDVSKTGDIEKIRVEGAHGPREVHVIFLDNGRSKMLRDERFMEALLCMRCGACLYECPVYQVVCGYFGDYYFGGIGAIWMSFIDSIEKAIPYIYTCMLCGKCREVCPMKINTPEMILTLREETQKSGLIPKKFEDLKQKLIRDGNIYK